MSWQPVAEIHSAEAKNSVCSLAQLHVSTLSQGITLQNSIQVEQYKEWKV